MAFFLLTTLAFAKSGEEIAKELKLNPSSKAIKQWDRVFASPEKLTEIGAAKLSPGDQAALKKYLQDHAADSDKPTVAGQ
jgi:hypothetical protein